MFRKFLSGAHQFAKKTRLLSRILNHYGHSGLSSMASMAGYGRRRRYMRRRRVGRGLGLAGGALHPVGWSRGGMKRMRITNLPMAY